MTTSLVKQPSQMLRAVLPGGGAALALALLLTIVSLT